MCFVRSSELYLQIIPLFFIIKKWLNSHLRLEWQPGLSWVSSPSPTVFPISVVFPLLPLPSTANLVLQQSVANVPPSHVSSWEGNYVSKAPVRFHYCPVRWGVAHWQVIKKPNDLLTGHQPATRLIVTQGSTIKSDAKDILDILFSDSEDETVQQIKIVEYGSKVQGIRIHGVPVHGINDTTADIAIMREKLFKEVANVRKRNIRSADKMFYTYNQ